MSGFTVERNEFLDALAATKGIIGRNNTIPILNNVLLEAEGDRLRITATNLDMQMETSCPAQIDGFENVTVGGAVLAAFLSRAREDKPVMAVCDTGKVKLKSARTRIALASLPAQDFPSMSVFSGSHQFEMDAKELRDIIEKVGVAVSTEETRYYLNGIFMHHKADDPAKLVFAATDGHRLIKREVDAPQGANETMPGVIIPRGVLPIMLRLLAEMAKSNEPARISLSQNQIRLETPRATVTSKLIDGNFPDYERILPRANPHEFHVPVSDLKSSMERMATLFMDNTNVALQFASGTLTLTHSNSLDETIEDALDIEGSDEEIRIAFSGPYVLDLLSAVDTGRITMRLMDAGAPALILPEGSDCQEAVLMPMRILTRV